MSKSMAASRRKSFIKRYFMDSCFSFQTNLNRSHLHELTSSPPSYVTATGNGTPSKRVTFKDSPLAEHKQRGSKSPMYVEAGRRKILYGVDSKCQQQRSPREADDASDQGSHSTDSGRGPSEEDPEVLARSASTSSSHNHSTSFNDSHESCDVSPKRRNNGYVDMTQVQRTSGYFPTSSMVLAHAQPLKTRPPSGRTRPKTAVIHPHYAPIHPQQQENLKQFPDLHVPNFSEKQTNCDKPSVTSRRCEKHNVVDHFPELCQRNVSLPGWSGVTSSRRDDVDARSDGESTTSGSYFVDNNVFSCEDLQSGPEISRDVFV